MPAPELLDDPPLEAATRALVGALATGAVGESFYLAGSAALTCWIGHRRVRDLDLMAADERLRPAGRRDWLAELVHADPGLVVETARDGLLHARSSTGTAVKLFYYPYPLVAPTTPFDGLPVASLLDLGLMKLGAIISRGTRRDFCDLYLLCRQVDLETLLAAAPRKFPRVDDFPLQALKGLADSSAAGEEPLPALTLALDWPTVEGWAAAEARRLGRRRLGLRG